jgi:hypothetical protein
MLYFAIGNAVENGDDVFAAEVGISLDATAEISTGAGGAVRFKHHPIADFPFRGLDIVGVLVDLNDPQVLGSFISFLKFLWAHPFYPPYLP